MQKDKINVAFIGNPNCGKTTLFNAYTGAKLKVANWPGVTVEKKEGEFEFQGVHLNLVDLPGIYSLTSYTMEEKLSREYILGNDVDVIIDVIDASALERNLYLALQLIELGKPVVLALNMMDIVEERGMEIDMHRLPEMLGVPAIPVCARKRQGLDILMHAVIHHSDSSIKDHIEHHHKWGSHVHPHHEEYAMVYSDGIEDKIDIIISLLKKNYPNLTNYRWYAIKLLEHDEQITSKYQVELPKECQENMESQIIDEKYAFIEEVIEEVLVNKNTKSQKTDKIDSVLTHPFWGIPIFLLIMAAVFFFTFTIGDFLKGYFEIALDAISNWVTLLLEKIHVGAVVTSLVTDGIIAGVGGVLTFLPNIFILFLALAFLEDSGYMSRVAYVMDGIMSKIGLSGRAFIPMLLGFGCTVPAVLASRALENKKDRIKTILGTPFMSCSARLPIYVLFSEMFFENNAMLAAYSMYVIGLVVGILVIKFMGLGKKNTKNTLLIELPEYKSPNARTISIYVWEKIKDYLTKAGTTIFIASIVLWALLNFGPHGMVSSIEESFAATIGKWIAPVLKPAGLGQWQIAVALISGIAAKEVVVSSMGVLYNIGNVLSESGMASLAAILGSTGFTAINAYSMMLFCLLYTPCMATIATIKKETGSLKLTWASILLQLGIAWIVSTLFFQIASLVT